MILNEANQSSKDKYIDYLQTHIRNVRRSWETYLRKYFRGTTLIQIEQLISDHDKDKFLEDNIEVRADHYYNDDIRFLSVPKDHKPSDEFSEITDTHKLSNAHHWEFWIDDNGDPQEMDLPHIIEMLCDWSSFQFIKTRSGNANTWYETHKDELILHPKTREQVEKWLLREPGL